LEGNTYSKLETEKLLLKGVPADDKLTEERIMILNHKEAIRYLVDREMPSDISMKTLLTVHYLLSDGLVDTRYSGAVRDYGVRIGGSTFVPFEDHKRLTLFLERVLSLASQIRDPYEQSFFLLVHLSYLQPFVDVNKRVARLCSNIPLIRHNLVPLSFNDVNRSDYLSAIIAVYELCDVRPLVDLYLFFSYLRTCAQYDATVVALGFDEVRVKYRAFRRQLLQAIIQRKLREESLNAFLAEQTAERIEPHHRLKFQDDLFDDLKGLNEIKIRGLGVTLLELNNYLELINN